MPVRRPANSPLMPAILALLLGGLAAQDAGPDPFTEGKPAALAKLGYQGFGPFALGD